MKLSLHVLKRPAGAALHFLLLAIACSRPACAADEVAHWQFSKERNEDGRFSDLTGMNSPATVGKAQDGARLDFSAQGIADVPSAATLDGAGTCWINAPIRALETDPDYAVEIWFAWDGSGTAQETIFANASGLILAVKEEGKLFAMLAAGDEGKAPSWAYAELPERLSSGDWQHVVLRVEKGSLLLSRFPIAKKGATVQSSAETRIPGTPKPIRWPATALGINPYNRSSPFAGRIAALKIYRGAPDDKTLEASQP